MHGTIKHTIEKDDGEIELAVEYDYDRAERTAEITRVGLAEKPLGWSDVTLGHQWREWDYTTSIDADAVAMLCCEDAERRIRDEIDRDIALAEDLADKEREDRRMMS